MTPTLTLIAVACVFGFAWTLISIGIGLLIGRCIPPSQDDALHQRGEGHGPDFDQSNHNEAI